MSFLQNNKLLKKSFVWKVQNFLEFLLVMKDWKNSYTICTTARKTVKSVFLQLYNLCSTNCTSNNNQLKDIKDVNNVASVPISKDAERILSLKAKWCKQGISPD